MPRIEHLGLGFGGISIVTKIEPIDFLGKYSINAPSSEMLQHR